MTSNTDKDSAKPKFVFFSDFDGTITMIDSNVWLASEYGYGKNAAKHGDTAVIRKTVTFRESFKEELDSIPFSANKCVELLEDNIMIDPYFSSFYDFCLQRSIPFTVLSSGLDYFINPVLMKFIQQSHPEAKDMDVVCNKLVLKPGKTLDDEDGWTIEYRDDTDFGHDKSRAIKPWKDQAKQDRPIIFFAGDGTSDISAAKQADVLFAKKGKMLIEHCEKEGIRYVEWESWADIQRVVEDVVLTGMTVEEVLAQEANKSKTS